MRALLRLLKRLISVVTRENDEERLQTEIDEHLALRTADNIRAGLSPIEARRQAVLSFGAVEAVTENYRDEKGLPFIETLIQDVRYAMRTLGKHRTFSFVAILVLALGIGTTTAIFSVVNAVLIRPLPYQDPSRLVALSSLYRRAGITRSFPTVSLNEVEQWRPSSRSLQSLGSFVFTALPVTVNSQTIFLVAIGADPELLRTLGVHAAIGRDLAGGGSKFKDPSVVISHRLWAGAFDGDSHVVGRNFVMDGSTVVVVGVLPASFQFPRSDASYFTEEPDIVFPVANIADNWGRDSAQWFAVGRLKPGVTRAQSESELKTLTAHMALSGPGLRGMSVRVSALDAETTRSVRPALLITMGIAVVLLLIACANIMNLLFSRAAQRAREMAVRQAVGASAWRLVRQMLTETACITFLGGLLGVGLARFSLDSLVALSPAHLPISGRVEIDWIVLSFAFFVCAAASFLSGLIPAVYRTRQSVALISAGTRSSSSRPILRWQHALMVSQIALGVGLMSAAGLLAHSLLRLSSVDPGFRTQGTVGFEIAFPEGIPRETTQIYDRILSSTRNLPGVVSAGWITNLPPETRAGVFVPLSIPGIHLESKPFCNFQVTSEDYFNTAGIGFTRGRDFSIADATAAPAVAIVNEALARQFFPNSDPLGRRIVSFDGREREIVGIIRDLHDRGLNAKPAPTVFVPFRQFALPYGAVMARTNGPAAAILPEIRRRIAMADPSVALNNLTSINARVRKTLDSPRFYTFISVTCALMAILFVSLGLYGVISYAVASRTTELGIRMALGAPRVVVLRSVLSHGLKLAAIGTALGISLAIASTRLLSTLLFQIKPIDPPTLGLAAALAVILTITACYFPARRASLIDPMVALRYD